MNEIVNKLLLVSDKFMSEMHLKHLKQPGFTYSACGPFIKNKEKIEKFMQTGNTDFIYKSQLDKACFQHDLAYDKLKDLAKRTQSDKVLRDKAFKIASNPKYDGHQKELISMIYKFFDKKNLVEVVLTMNQVINLQLKFISRLFDNLRKERSIHHIETIFGVLI